MVCLMAAAQPRLKTPEVYLGVHGGVMGSMMIFSPSVDGAELKYAPFTPNGGLVFRYAGHKVCAIQAEVNYMQRGWREVVETTQTDYTRLLHYIEVPLLMHLYFGGARARGFVNLGPQIGWCFSDVATGTPQSKYTHQYGPIKPFDYGLALGLGFCYRTRHIGAFQLEARGNYSLSGVFGTKKVDYFSMANQANVCVNIAYLFEFHNIQ